MIGLKIDNEWLDLPPTINIPIEWESGMFSDDISLSGIATMPFSFPFTDKNRRLLKHFDMVTNKLKNVKLDCEIYLAHNFWTKGTLTVIARENSQMFDCDFSEVNVFADIADRKLAEFFPDTKDYIIDTFKRWMAIQPTNTGYFGGDRFLRFYFGTNNLLFTIVDTGQTFADIMDELYSQMNANTEFMSNFNITRETIGSEEIIYIEAANDDTIEENINLTFTNTYGFTDVTTAYGGYNDWANIQRDAIVTKLNSDLSLTYPDTKYCFPIIKNDEFYGSNNSNYVSQGKFINYYLKGYGYNHTRYGSIPDREFYRSISPQYFLFYIIKEICNKYGIIPNGSLLAIDEFYERCFIYSNSAADKIAFSRYYPFNCFAGTHMRNSSMPDTTLKELFQAIKVIFSTSLFLRNGALNFELNKTILSNTDVQDWSNKSFKYYDELLGCYINGFVLKYAMDGSDSYLSSHIKDVTINRKSDVPTYADLPTGGVINNEIRLVTSESKFYQATFDNVNIAQVVKWTFYSINLYDYSVLNDLTNMAFAPTELDSKDSPTINDDYIETVRISGTDHIRQINIPFIFQPGSSKEYNQGINPIPFRLLLYWGVKKGRIQTDPGNPEATPPIPPTFGSSSAAEMDYPFASIDNFDMNGNQLGDYALRFDGPYGLYENFHKEWLAFRNQAKKLTIKIILDAADLLQLEISKKIQIKECQYLIHKIRGTVQPISNKIECIVELYKL
jgi:hypothetical protein